MNYYTLSAQDEETSLSLIKVIKNGIDVWFKLLNKMENWFLHAEQKKCNLKRMLVSLFFCIKFRIKDMSLKSEN